MCCGVVFHLVWLVFEGSIPTCTCFHLENSFVTCNGDKPKAIIQKLGVKYISKEIALIKILQMFMSARVL